MAKLCLLCAVVGKAGGTFGVKIDSREKAWKLKDVIKEKLNDLKDIEDKKLQLFLAMSKDGAWLQSTGRDVTSMQSGDIPEQVESLLDEEMNPRDEIGGLFEDIPMEKTIHVLVRISDSICENPRKRIKLEDEDGWITTIQNEKITALPSTHEDLKKHLQRPLQVKIPINTRLSDIISSQNTTGELSSLFNKLFESKPRGLTSDITGAILKGVIDPIRFDSRWSYDIAMYHYLWGSAIAVLLKIVTGGEFLRNRKLFDSTGVYRPSLCFYVKNSNVCVLRGEEKAHGGLDIPVKELERNLKWRYDDAPYLFGYAAVGLVVRLFAIRKDGSTEKVGTYNLGYLKDRLSLFLTLLNLSTLLQPVVDFIQPMNILEYTTSEEC